MSNIVFSHPKGGVGKSLLAFNMYVKFKIDGYNPLLIDLDGQKSLSFINSLRQDSIKDSLDISPDIKSEEQLYEIMKKSATDKRITIIDTGGFDSAFNRVAIAYSDLILTPFSDSPIELMRLDGFNDILEDISKKNSDKLIAHLVLNRLHIATKKLDDAIEFVENYPHFTLLKSVVKDRSKIKNTIANGLSVFDKEAKKECKGNKQEKKNLENAKNDLMSLYKEIKKIIKESKNG